VQEFELISHESECMKRKLLSQEDEFRLQNETLMAELGQVSCCRMSRDDKILGWSVFLCGVHFMDIFQALSVHYELKTSIQGAHIRDPLNRIGSDL